MVDVTTLLAEIHSDKSTKSKLRLIALDLLNEVKQLNVENKSLKEKITQCITRSGI